MQKQTFPRWPLKKKKAMLSFFKQPDHLKKGKKEKKEGGREHPEMINRVAKLMAGGRVYQFIIIYSW